MSGKSASTWASTCFHGDATSGDMVARPAIFARGNFLPRIKAFAKKRACMCRCVPLPLTRTMPLYKAPSQDTPASRTTYRQVAREVHPLRRRRPTRVPSQRIWLVGRIVLAVRLRSTRTTTKQVSFERRLEVRVLVCVINACLLRGFQR
jgi:hypothetical protein